MPTLPGQLQGAEDPKKASRRQQLRLCGETRAQSRAAPNPQRCHPQVHPEQQNVQLNVKLYPHPLFFSNGIRNDFSLPEARRFPGFCSVHGELGACSVLPSALWCCDKVQLLRRGEGAPVGSLHRGMCGAVPCPWLAPLALGSW